MLFGSITSEICPQIGRSIICANATFAHILASGGHFDRMDSPKSGGDAFEAVAGAFYETQGVEPFTAWYGKVFKPLVEGYSLAYDRKSGNDR